jgi:hypothetical protein
MSPEKSVSPLFDWAIYADATLAGLSVLIPIPFIDSLFETFFRRRMPSAIARRHGYPLPPTAEHAINHVSTSLMDRVSGCILAGLNLIFELILRLVRKILYFLTVKKSIDVLTYYWQRAFLLEHMMQMGYLDNPQQVPQAVLTLEEVLDEVGSNPLRQLAAQIITSPWRILRSLWQARQGREDDTVAETRSLMARTWDSFAGYLATVAEHYDARYAAAVAKSEETPPTPIV